MELITFIAYCLLDLIERIAIMDKIWRLHNESHVLRLKVFSAIRLARVQVENNKIDVSENDVAW